MKRLNVGSPWFLAVFIAIAVALAIGITPKASAPPASPIVVTPFKCGVTLEVATGVAEEFQFASVNGTHVVNIGGHVAIPDAGITKTYSPLQEGDYRFTFLIDDAVVPDLTRNVTVKCATTTPSPSVTTTTPAPSPSASVSTPPATSPIPSETVSTPPATETTTPGACTLTGAIFTTDSTGHAVNANIYDSKEKVYLNGGPDKKGSLLPDGTYYVRITDPSGSVVLSVTRTVTVVDGVFPLTQLAPFSDTPNNGGEYKVWVSRTADFTPSCSKTDNFKVKSTVTPTPTVTTTPTATETPTTPTPTETTPTASTTTPAATTSTSASSPQSTAVAVATCSAGKVLVGGNCVVPAIPDTGSTGIPGWVYAAFAALALGAGLVLRKKAMAA